MSRREHSGGSPVTIPGSPKDDENSLTFLREIEINHANIQPMNLQPPLDFPETQESFEAIMEAKRRKEEIKMIQTPIAWTIRKTLTKSDLTILRLSVNPVAEHVLSHLSDIPTNRSEIIINVHDYDSDSRHIVSLNYGRDGYDRFGGFWKANFVQRRELKEGDEIGLAWNPSTSTFVFGVISGVGKYINPQER